MLNGIGTFHAQNASVRQAVAPDLPAHSSDPAGEPLDSQKVALRIRFSGGNKK